MGWIDENGYHKGSPPDMSVRQNSTWKAHDHKKQRLDHARELVQPYKNNKPNEEFIQAFPEESKDYGFLPKDEDLNGH